MGVIIKFKDLHDDSTLQVQSEEGSELVISVTFEMESENLEEAVWMDIETAVKFSKELRRQIAIAKDNIQYKKEQANG